MLSGIKKLTTPFLFYAVILLVTFSGFRFSFIIWQNPHFTSSTDIVTALINGLRIDLSSIGYLFLLPSLLLAVVLKVEMLRKSWRKILNLYFMTTFSLVVFLELATPTFILEYGQRPNRLFVEYLTYPKEVFTMLINGHLADILLILGSLAVICLYMTFPLSKKCGQTETHDVKFSNITILASVIILISTFFIFARGTLGHRPINPAFVYYSTDPLINSLTLNSAYSVAHAIKEMSSEITAAKMYGEMSDEKVIALVRQETGLSTDKFAYPDQPSRANRQPSYRGKPKNLVIILEESLGAQYVAALGGLPLTPNIDKLYASGWGFKQMYATGTRSVRGIEAVITGFTPTPARAVVKLNQTQNNFFTIASLLKAQGFHTQFIYGGESHFDNMKSFFLGNGFEQIVDYDGIQNPAFVGSWGASDGDLFEQADRELINLHNQGTPFFSLIFTSSNHDPFEIPPGTVNTINYSEQQLQEFDQNELKRHQAIQYADFALGKFIERAKTKPYWDNTVFLIVADHDARAQGQHLVPIHNFHIPAVILNSSKQTADYSAIASQIDLAPTLLSLIGVANDSPMLGRDLTNSSLPGRALMQYANNFAYLTEQGAVILRPNNSPLAFNYNAETHAMTAKNLTTMESDIALAHAFWGSLALQHQWYKFQ